MREDPRGTIELRNLLLKQEKEKHDLTVKLEKATDDLESVTSERDALRSERNNLSDANKCQSAELADANAAIARIKTIADGYKAEAAKCQADVEQMRQRLEATRGLLQSVVQTMRADAVSVEKAAEALRS